MSYRIGVDCRLAGRQHAGIGRYIENLITRLPQLAPEGEWVFFLSDKEQAQEVLGRADLLDNPKIKTVIVPVRHYTIQEQFRLPGVFSAEHLDLLHVPHFNIALGYQGKLIVTIHDLLWHEYMGPEVTTLPTWQYWLKHRVYKWVVSQAVYRAKRIIVPAQTICQPVRKFYPQVTSKIRVTKEGIDQDFLTAPKKSSAKVHNQFVYVGSLYPHKNIAVVLRALQQLPEYTLKIVGTRNIFQDQVKSEVERLGVASQVEFLGYMPGPQLDELLQESTALVQPSFSEGFGLTGVEAMAVGVPVLASDIPIFREIYGNAAIYFDPHQPNAFVQAVASLAKKDRAQVIHRAQRWVKQYSWEIMAEQTWRVYKEVLHEKA